MLLLRRIKFKSKVSEISRTFSAQSAASFKPNDEEFSKALPFKAIPGPNKFELVKRFLPGGKFHKLSIIDVLSSMRSEFGDFYRMPGMFGQAATVITYDPNDVEFIHRNEGAYPFRRGLETLKHFREKVRRDVYSVGGLTIEQGVDWYNTRTAINPVLMKPQIVKSYIPTIDSIVNEFMHNIPSMQDDRGEMPANFSEYLNLWSLESITAIALEKRLGLTKFDNSSELGKKIAKAVRDIITRGLEFEMKPSIWRYYETKSFKELMRAYNDLTNLSSLIIDEALEKIEKESLKSFDGEQGILFKLLEKDKRYATVMAFDMIFAGIDTTSSALSTIMYCLAKNPQKQEKLRDELINVMPDRNTPLTGDSMTRMPFLRAVIKEALRLFPPAMSNMRRAAENLVIRGYQIPKGVDLMMGMVFIYKDPKSFGDPEMFVPERWLREQDACPHSMKQSHPFSYLPFGFGARFCAGKRIAQMELEVFTSRLFRNYKVEWHHEDLKIKSTLVLLPDGDLKFKLIRI